MPTNENNKIKDANQLVRESCQALRDSDRSFASIYGIVFSRKQMIMAETSSLLTGIVEYTYEEAEKCIEAVSASMQARFGSDNQFIALAAENSVEWLFLFWGILKSGNRPFLVNLKQPVAFAVSMMDILEVKNVVGTAETENYGRKMFFYQDLLKEGLLLSKCTCPFGDEIALSTSGTTLKEKICFYHGTEISEMILNSESACRKNKKIKTTYHDRVKMLVMIPLYHIFGIEAVYLWFSFFGVSFVFPENLSPDVLMRTIREHEVTHIFSVPVMWHTIEKSVRRELAKRDEKTRKKFEKGILISEKLQEINPWLGLWISSKLFHEVREKIFGESVQFCVSGGGNIQPSSLRMLNAIGYMLMNGYGMSEIGITSVNLSPSYHARLNGSVGKPFASAEYQVDERNHLLVRASTACKKMSISGVMTEMPEWYDTGDLARLDSEGYCYLLGRASDLVIGENGENLNPALAEESFRISTAKNMCILGDETNEHLIMILQVSDKLVELQRTKLENEIESGLRKLPSAYRIQKILYTYDPIMGDGEIKVSRAKLRKKIQNGEIALLESLKPSEENISENPEDSEVKGIVRSLMADVLQMDGKEISGSAHFMNDLGGSSLDYYMLVTQLEERFDIPISMEGENFHYSLDDFTRVIEAELSV